MLDNLYLLIFAPIYTQWVPITLGLLILLPKFNKKNDIEYILYAGILNIPIIGALTIAITLAIFKKFTIRIFVSLILLQFLYLFIYFVFALLFGTLDSYLCNAFSNSGCEFAGFGGFIAGPIWATGFNLIIGTILLKHLFKEKSVDNQNTQLETNTAASPLQPTSNAAIESQRIINNSNEKKRKVPIWIIIELILILIFIVSLSGIFILPEIIYQIKKPKTPEISKISTISTSNWATFEGKSLGISFKYPSNWQKLENEYVSELKPTKKEIEEDYLIEKSKERKLNIIYIRRDSRENSNQYNYVLERFNKTKSFPLNKESFEDEVNDIKVTKIKEGKLSSGEEYLLFNRNDYRTQDNFNNLSIMIKADDAIYSLILDHYNENGQNVLVSLIPTISISKNKNLEPRTFENKYFSINYPDGADVDESTDIDGNKKIGFLLDGKISSNIEVDGTIETSTYDQFYDDFDYWDEAYYIDSKKDIDELLNDPYYSKVTDIKDINGYRMYIIDKEFATSKKRIYIVKDDFAMEIIYDRLSEADVSKLDEIISSIKLKN